MSIFGLDDNPYYIWAPRWIDSSAGIRCIHYLCHNLNSIGGKAYLVFAEPRHRGEPRLNANLNTPELTQEVIDAHKAAGKVPIAVYPEDVVGNPLGAPFVIRFLWNYAGALGGPAAFDEDEHVVAFSRNIALNYAQSGHATPDVLFVPPVDPSEFLPNLQKKEFQVVYAGKYRSFVGKPPKIGDLPTVEIFRDGPKKQPRSLVKKLLAEATVVYSFENSSIVTEAILSGTPAGFVPNQFLQEIIADHELGTGGVFSVDDPEGLSKARGTLEIGREKYLRAVATFPDELAEFHKRAQEKSRVLGFIGEVQLPSYSSPVTRNRVLLGLSLIRNKGPRVFFVEVARFFRRRL